MAGLNPELTAAVAERETTARSKPLELPPFKGETFKGRVPGGLAFMEFIAAGDLDTDADDPAEVMEANRAVLEFLQSLLLESEWRRFRRHCRVTQASTTELGALIREWVTFLVGRPTQSQPPSPGEPPSSGDSSKVAATAPATE